MKNTNKSFLYGLDHTSRDFTIAKSFGKNIFTNAFPVSLAIYMSKELGLEPNYIHASLNGSDLTVEHTTKALEEIIGTSLEDAYWAFEASFSGYDALTTDAANRSDLVVSNLKTGEETRAFEVKLVTAPTSKTANRERVQQSCEIVVRPPTIKQICFSIAASYGANRQHDIGDMITERLNTPMNYDWSNERYMFEKLPLIVATAEDIIREGIELQTPFVMNALWRTIGKSAKLDDECFDLFFWSDMAFLQLFTEATKRAIASGKTKINRPSRSLIWLVKSLLDYSTQGTITFEQTHSEITYGGQSDKAGSFSDNSVMPLIGCQHFYHPRVSKDHYKKIISPKGIEMLSPERRLDAYIKTDCEYGTVKFGL